MLPQPSEAVRCSVKLQTGSAKECRLEFIDGKLMWGDTMRLLLVGLLIKNTGLDKLVQLGGPKAWKAAIAKKVRCSCSQA